jgi:hypothetical protein
VFLAESPTPITRQFVVNRPWKNSSIAQRKGFCFLRAEHQCYYGEQSYQTFKSRLASNLFYPLFTSLSHAQSHAPSHAHFPCKFLRSLSPSQHFLHALFIQIPILDGLGYMLRFNGVAILQICDCTG